MRVALPGKVECSISAVRLLSTSIIIVTIEQHASTVELPYSLMLMLGHARASLECILEALYRATLAYIQGFKVKLGEKRNSVECV